MRETWVRSLGWEDPLEEGMATHSSIFAWRIPMDRGVWGTTVLGVAKSLTRLGTAQQCTLTSLKILCASPIDSSLFLAPKSFRTEDHFTVLCFCLCQIVRCLEPYTI